MAKAKCYVRFERARNGAKVDAVLYRSRDGVALNAIQGMFTPVRASAARDAKRLLMRGCDELARPMRPPRRVALGFIWPFAKKPAKRKLRVGEKRIYMIRTPSGKLMTVGPSAMQGARRRRKRR